MLNMETLRKPPIYTMSSMNPDGCIDNNSSFRNGNKRICEV
ncbi:MAG: hypothetical protein QXY40_04585 [Candidatus Methanomethylicia archaeon]